MINAIIILVLVVFGIFGIRSAVKRAGGDCGCGGGSSCCCKNKKEEK